LNVGVEGSNMFILAFIFAFEFSLNRIKLVYSVFFSFEVISEILYFAFKFRDILILLCGDGIDNFLLILLKDLLDLREVSFDDVCHVSEVFEEVGYFFFELAAEGLLYFRLH
jgi:hypothetical protein